MASKEQTAAQLEADGWTVDREALGELEQDLQLDDPEGLSTLTNPFRIRMLTSLARNPDSVKGLAGRLDVPVTRLYHHLAQLEELGAVRVVATRRSGARTERCYGAGSRGIGLSPALMTGHPDQVGEAVAKLVALAGETMAAAVRAGKVTLGAHRQDTAADDGPGGDSGLAWQATRLTPAQRRDLVEELEAVAVRVAELSKRNEAEGVAEAEPTVALFLVTPDVTVAT